MKRIPITGVMIAILAVAGIFSSCAAPEEKASPTPVATATVAMESPADTEREIRKLQMEYDKAALEQDAAAYDRLFADDFTLTQAGGKITTRAETIAAAKAGDTKMQEGRSDDIKVRVYGNTTIVTCRWTEKSITKGKPFSGALRYTTVWVKKNGKWQIVSDQGTLITP